MTARVHLIYLPSVTKMNSWSSSVSLFLLLWTINPVHIKLFNQIGSDVDLDPQNFMNPDQGKKNTKLISKHI